MVDDSVDDGMLREKGEKRQREALYKTKVAKLKDEIQRRPAASRRGPTHRVEKSGAGQIVFVGPPNAGKSKIIRELTGVDVEVADYPFTTRAASPFMMPYRNIRIQLVDAPPTTSEYMETWFPETIKAADAVCLVADLGDPEGAGVMDMARAVHKDFKEKLNYARVWNSRGLDGLRVTRDYFLEDEDTVELHL